MPTIRGDRLIEAPATLRTGRGGVLVIEQEVKYNIDIESGTPDLSEITIALTTPNLPQAGINGCKSVQVVRHPQNRLLATATCLFSSEVEENTDPQTPNNTGSPVEWIPQAEVEFEPYDEVAREDKDGKKYLNSAGDPFETGLMLHRRIASRVFTQFENVAPDAPAWAASTAYRVGQYVSKSSVIYQATVAGTSGGTGPSGTGTGIVDGGVTWRSIPAPPSGAVNISQIEQRCDTVNSHTFLGRPPGTLLLDVRRATIGTYYNVRVWRIEYVLKYKADGWKPRQYNMGWRYKDGSTKKFFEEEIGGTKVAFLGKLKADGTPVDDQLTDDPSIEEFREHDELNFNTFLRIV